MKVIITDQLSVAQAIARAVHARQGEHGYFYADNYQIAGTCGHLLTLCQPKEPWNLDTLPLIPERWSTEPVQQSSGNASHPDNDKVYQQLQLLGHLCREADELISATDFSARGELLFRQLYEYLSVHYQVSTPYSRLWISSLTDTSIRAGLSSLRNRSEFDSIAKSAKSRLYADWLISVNGTRALTLAARNHTPSTEVLAINRIYTPVLCMICERFIKNSYRIPGYTLNLITTLSPPYQTFTVIANVRFSAVAEARACVAQINNCTHLYVNQCTQNQISQPPPLLFNFTALCEESYVRYNLSYKMTTESLHALYVSGHITYPYTDTRFITWSDFEQLPLLISKLRGYRPYSSHIENLHEKTFFTHSVSDEKTFIHPPILPTEKIPGDTTLPHHQKLIYELILLRLLESISAPCLKNEFSVTLVSDQLPGTIFSTQQTVITSPGWYAIHQLYHHPTGNSAENTPAAFHPFYIGQALPVPSSRYEKVPTQPPPQLTENTLCEMMKADGIAPPVSRASVIEALLAKGLISRDKESLLPTEKGLYYYQLIKDTSVGNTTLLKKCERALKRIESGKANADSFDRRVCLLTRVIVHELASLSFAGQPPIIERPQPAKSGPGCLCPKCRKHTIVITPHQVCCSSSSCDFRFKPVIAGRHLTSDEIVTLCTHKKTEVLKGFTSRSGKKFDKALVLSRTDKISFAIDPSAPTDIPCPKCGKPLSLAESRIFCINKSCGYNLFRMVRRHCLTEAELRHLFTYKRTDVIYDLEIKRNRINRRKSRVYLMLTNDHKIDFVYIP